MIKPSGLLTKEQHDSEATRSRPKGAEPAKFSGKPFVEMTNADITAARKSVRRVGLGTRTEEDIPGFIPGVPEQYLDGKGGIKRPGQVNASSVDMSRGFKMGDRVYHTQKKVLGKVLDVKASGSVEVKLDGFKRGWVRKEILQRM